MPEHELPFRGGFPDDLNHLDANEPPVFDAEVDPTSVPDNRDYVDPETFASRLAPPLEDAAGIEGESIVQSELRANMWRSRAANVQTTVFTTSLGAVMIWMATNAYSIAENFSPGTADPYISHAFYNVTSMGRLPAELL